MFKSLILKAYSVSIYNKIVGQRDYTKIRQLRTTSAVAHKT